MIITIARTTSYNAKHSDYVASFWHNLNHRKIRKNRDRRTNIETVIIIASEINIQIDALIL